MEVQRGVAAEPSGGQPTARPVDALALARHAGRLLRAPAPWLHVEVARRMAGRLRVLRSPPQRVVDWGAHGLAGAGAGAKTSEGAAPLREACKHAHHTAAALPPGWPRSDGAVPTAQDDVSTLPWWTWRRWSQAARPGLGGEPPIDERNLREGQADLLWSNMVLHHLAEPQTVFGRWRQLLAVDGILMFSTLGPGTLETLRGAYRRAGWGPPHAPFVDMHDLGDMLVNAGFADPVMDQEVIRLSWATAREALAELRQLGGNAAPGRFAGLRTPRWRNALESTLQARRDAVPPRLAGAGAGQACDGAGLDARVVLEFEVVYGHAVRPPARVRMAAESTLPLAELRGMLRGPQTGSNGPTR
ncbi:MAG: methyltransferase domain-containing protein [Rubrivivax sp.]|nr:methyltransferase domain-containing protein [Rubrivivax sp.]